MRLQRRSASARSCVVRTIVAPCSALTSSTNAWTSSLLRGSRPVVGSSRSSSVGLVSRARAMATFCCMPRLICSTGPAETALRDAEPGEDRRRLPLRVAGIEAVEAGGEQQVLHRAQLLEEGRIDRHPVDEPLDRELVALDVEAEHLDPALVQGQQPRDEADEGRLAGAVGAQDPVDRATLQAERDVVDREDRGLAPVDVEALGDVLDEQGRRAGRDPGPEGGALGVRAGRDPRGGLEAGERWPAAGSTSEWSSSVRARGWWSRDPPGWMGGLRWMARCGEPVRGVPDMGRAAGPAIGGPRGSASSGRRRALKNERAGGPVAHGSVGRSRASALRPTLWWAHLSRERGPRRARSAARRGLRSAPFGFRLRV